MALSLDHFRSHPAVSTCKTFATARLRFQAWDSKICYLHGKIFSDEYIFWLKIPMNYSLGMKIIHSTSNIKRELQNEIMRKWIWLLLVKVFSERAACHVLSNDAEDRRFLACCHKLHSEGQIMDLNWEMSKSLWTSSTNIKEFESCPSWKLT